MKKYSKLIMLVVLLLISLMINATVLAGDYSYTLNVNADKKGINISPTLYGAFFEDINHAADGGIYAELIRNRSFEFGYNLGGWELLEQGSGRGSISVQNSEPLNSNNSNYLKLDIQKPGVGVGVINSGYGGIKLAKGHKYRFSVYARVSSDFEGPLKIQLDNKEGEIYGEGEISGLTSGWHKYSTIIKVDQNASFARLSINGYHAGTVWLDMVSLFPIDTWKHRENGLRPDLVKMLVKLQPKFFRFPGGCIVEGDSLQNVYNWKNTIGDVSSRKTNRNLWGYHQSYGLGFHEYFQLAEDIGAEPLPVISAGLSCQFRGPEYVPMNSLDKWIQNALDLIEYANGPVSSIWGAKRAENGHPRPFNLKYLGIGNENWGPGYFKRYQTFYKAIKKKYPDVKLVTTSGPAPDDYNYARAYEWFKDHPADIVDEHMYKSPEWFLENADRYDSYDREGPEVFVGEYAAHTGNRQNNLKAAIAEAAFMTGLERNSDVVVMASYAPLFNNVYGSQWTPDLIWFNKSQVMVTPSYYVQKMFSRNTGDVLIPTTLQNNQLDDENSSSNRKQDVITGSIGLGSWQTRVDFDDVIVESNGKLLFYDNFNDKSNKWKVDRGYWQLDDGVYKQTIIQPNTLSAIKSDVGSNYTLNVKARKTSGREGMLVTFGLKDAHNYYRWNLGGWGNTQTSLQKIVDGKSMIIGKTSTRTIETGKWYDIKIKVNGNHIRCYLNGELIHDVVDDVNPGPLYYVSSLEQDTGDIIMKVVNSSNRNENVRIKLNGIKDFSGEGTVKVLSSAHLDDKNTFENSEKVSPEESKLTGLKKIFAQEFPAHSVSIIRLRTR